MPGASTRAVFFPIVGWNFVGTGLFAWLRRPESRVGLLMVFVTLAGATRNPMGTTLDDAST